jgi:hypothetical protein
MYIIVLRNNMRNPHVDVDSHEFLETYSSYEEAKAAADAVVEAQGPGNEWYFNYAIYEEVTS